MIHCYGLSYVCFVAFVVWPCYLWIRLLKKLQFVVEHRGIYPFGPATTFAKYLDIVQWSIDLDGTLELYFDIQVNILHDSSKKIKQVVSRAFHEFVFQQDDHGRGIPSARVDVELFHKVFAKFSDADQRILLLNLVGGYQSNTAKSRWDKNIETKCDCCDQQDHVDHRHYSIFVMLTLRPLRSLVFVENHGFINHFQLFVRNFALLKQ